MSITKNKFNRYAHFTYYTPSERKLAREIRRLKCCKNSIENQKKIKELKITLGFLLECRGINISLLPIRIKRTLEVKA